MDDGADSATTSSSYHYYHAPLIISIRKSTSPSQSFQLSAERGNCDEPYEQCLPSPNNLEKADCRNIKKSGTRRSHRRRNLHKATNGAIFEISSTSSSSLSERWRFRTALRAMMSFTERFLLPRERKRPYFTAGLILFLLSIIFILPLLLILCQFLTPSPPEELEDSIETHKLSRSLRAAHSGTANFRLLKNSSQNSRYIWLANLAVHITNSNRKM